MSKCLIGIGSNLGDRQHNVEAAVRRLDEHPQIDVMATSGWMQSAPVGGPTGQDVFVNGVCAVDTTLTPHDTLAELLAVERSMGRSRETRWAPRTIDLDLLLFDDLVLRDEQLCLPHPWMAIRSFVMGPAAEVAPSWQHPSIGWTMRQLHDHLLTSPRRVLVVTSSPANCDRVLVDAGFAEIAPAVIRFDKDERAPSLRAYEQRTTQTDDSSEVRSEDRWEVSVLLVDEDACEGSVLRVALANAPRVRLKVTFGDESHKGWLGDEVRASGGPWLGIEAHDLARAAHDFRAALEGMN